MKGIATECNSVEIKIKKMFFPTYIDTNCQIAKTMTSSS